MSLRTPTDRLAGILATWFGVGYLPFTPGTFGSLAALPFAWVIATWIDPLALLPAAAIATAVGIWAAGRYERYAEIKDDQRIVIDEVAGQWLTLAFVPATPLSFAIGFVCFRAFDMAKPWPASWLDHGLPGGAGVVLDDVAAGVYAALVTWLLWEYAL